MRELAGHIESPLFLAHVRAAIGSAVQPTNCHPFRHENWLFVHHGYLGRLHAVRRDLMLAIDPDLFAEVQGSTDTEVVFYVALTFGVSDGSTLWAVRYATQGPARSLLAESTAVTVRPGGVLERQAFTPRVPMSATHA